MASIFTRIINGEIPCHKVAENDRFMAFLDINPLKQGHTLVVPRQETDYLFDLDDDLLSEMIIFSKKVAAAIRKTYPCNRVALIVLGLEVPHAHIHLIPMDSMEDVNFRNPKLKFSQDELRETAFNIGKNL
ncbi:MAG: HIT family protein [Bacteroidales bacterium]|nr:HIT family protein [Bacteroidales bacterium]